MLSEATQRWRNIRPQFLISYMAKDEGNYQPRLAYLFSAFIFFSLALCFSNRCITFFSFLFPYMLYTISTGQSCKRVRRIISVSFFGLFSKYEGGDENLERLIFRNCKLANNKNAYGTYIPVQKFKPFVLHNYNAKKFLKNG